MARLINVGSVSYTHLMEEYMKELALEYPMEFSIQGGFEKAAAVYDYEVILRAVENVLRNAFCCGYHQVTLRAESSREYLRFTVEDLSLIHI